MGRTHRERLFMAANRSGKSATGAFEAACHLTGIYPAWWEGHRFARPVKMWAAGMTSLETRDVLQTKLCGEPGMDAKWGTGMVPKDLLREKAMARGVSFALDTFHVKHRSGGLSICRFKSYEQGREKFQGETLDFVWFDEEPPANIYSEGLTRLTSNGRVMITFTPLLGDSELVLRFTQEEHPDRGLIGMTLNEAEHFTAEEIKQREEACLPYERDARIRGVPMRGEGRVFTVSEDQIAEDPLTYIPPYWLKIWGIDPGIAHPFGAVLIIWDRDNDVLHVHHAFRMKDALPIHHVQGMKTVGAAVPVAWPHDASIRDMGSGEPLARQYGSHGMQMLPKHSQWEDGSNSTYAGVLEMHERMKTGRLKVARQLVDWFDEFRMYHYKNAQIVKERDDILSATRIAIMSKRFARAVPLGRVAGQRTGERTIAKGIDDWDLFTGQAM
jgi:phage terminase large subunit-like protein